LEVGITLAVFYELRARDCDAVLSLGRGDSKQNVWKGTRR
jgi:hypothetical protein